MRLLTVRRHRWLALVFVWSLVAGHWSLLPAFAGQLPSLFRGVVVANGPFGIRIVSVEDDSQAALAGLRAEDVIVEINQVPVHTIDEFAVVSESLKGKATQARIVVLRNGQPRELAVHLYSVPILQHWGLSFVYEHDIRFAEASAGLEYWSRMGRGFEQAGNSKQALNAYLNALHDVPDQLPVAVKASGLLWKIAREQLKDHRLPEALAAIQQATALMERLFDQPLSATQLQTVKTELQATLAALRDNHR